MVRYMNLIRNEKHLKYFLLFALSLSMVLSCACIEETKNGSDNKNTPAAADGLIDEKDASTTEATKASQTTTTKEVKNESTTTTAWEEPVTEEPAEETEAVTEPEETTTAQKPKETTAPPETTTEAPETTTEAPETTTDAPETTPEPVPETPESDVETPANTEPEQTPAEMEPQETPADTEPEIIVVPAVVDPVEEIEANEETKGTRPPVVDETPDCDYVANMNSHKFHYPWCSSVDQMAEHNKWYFFGTREELIEAGYEPCKRCKP